MATFTVRVRREPDRSLDVEIHAATVEEAVQGVDALEKGLRECRVRTLVEDIQDEYGISLGSSCDMVRLALGLEA